MFTYYIHDGPSTFRFKLVGALADAAVAELEQCWLTASSTIQGRALVVDIDDLRGVDEAGRELLLRWRCNGAQFLAKSTQARLLGESILGQLLPIEPSRGERPAFRPFRLALTSSIALLTVLLPVTVRAAGASAAIPSAPIAQSVAASPSSILDRYNAAIENRGDQTERGVVALEIEASLPKLAKQGRLKAIRYPGPSGKPEYEVLQIDGDHTVRRQVIARYLSAEAAAQAMPSSAVAVSRANYKFHFVGRIGAGQNLAYVFQITPRKKRQGLIQGELWIDAATGIAVHQAGILVKRPSVFLRRVNIVQDTDLRKGLRYLQITRLNVDTLLGRAELTIRQHPAESTSDRDVATFVPNAGPATADAIVRKQDNEQASLINP